MLEKKWVRRDFLKTALAGNHRGAIYGWDQTLDNSMPKRLPHRTPIKNLYLAGAWTQPGHGYGAVIPSGLQCFATILEDWSKA